MRIVKKHDVRLNEIIDASEELFFSKGYDNTTINDILDKVEIGKGTFYHYFKSKEEVLDAILMRYMKVKVEAIENVANTEGMNAAEKIATMLFAQQPKNQQEIDTINKMRVNGNALLHQKAIQITIALFTPIFAKVIEQGVDEKIFTNPYAKETTEILLMAQFIFNDGVFNWTFEERIRKGEAFIYAMEAILGVEKGTFSYITKMVEFPTGEEQS